VEVWYEQAPTAPFSGQDGVESVLGSDSVSTHLCGEQRLFAVSDLIGTEHMVYGHSVAAIATAMKPTVVFK
ncbi:hypothetical protein Pmar_PMAR005125, partial [Perkinsus marinus ATCC 50983]